MIINDDSIVVNKLETLLNDDGARVFIYDRRVFIVQAIPYKIHLRTALK